MGQQVPERWHRVPRRRIRQRFPEILCPRQDISRAWVPDPSLYTLTLHVTPCTSHPTPYTTPHFTALLDRYLATSLNEETAHKFMLNAAEDKARVLWKVVVDKRGISDPIYRCRHAFVLEMTHVPGEEEYLFVPYRSAYDRNIHSDHYRILALDQCMRDV